MKPSGCKPIASPDPIKTFNSNVFLIFLILTVFFGCYPVIKPLSAHHHHCLRGTLPHSSKAISFKEDAITRKGSEPIPVQLSFVDLSRCIGCGICENKCPVRGKPAIRTLSAEESRSLDNQILL